MDRKPEGGQFVFKIAEWHEKYGPIVRITPWEIHICDPDFYDELYSAKSRHSKMPYLAHRFNIAQSTFDVVSHANHQRRRAAVAPFFSRQKILEFSPYIQSRVDRLCSIFQQQYAGTDKVICLNEAWGALAADSLTWYTQAMSYDFIEYPNFVAPFTTAIKNLAYSLHVTTHFPIVLRTLNALPQSLLESLNPEMGAVFRFHGEIKNQIRKIMRGESDSHKHVSHRTVFNELLSNLSKEEVSLTLMYHEAASITAAGIDTTKSVLTMASFWVLKDRAIHERLRQELSEAIPDPEQIPALADLEKLPYLNAVIQEALRLSYGVTQRLTRSNPHTPITYGNYVIPPNTPFGMTSYLQHRHPAIFPNPDSFEPERWLDSPKAGTTGRPLSKYLVPFSKGPRMCLGMNFAQAELFIALATVFRRVEFCLFDTDRDAVDMAADYFVPMPKAGTKGVRVTVKN
ncbi:cytochrome protein [Macrophomina phaseolina]|uniref:Cytochrome protein n=1 Tax=Macrophomina phaseolina TaxID=35725 RepID=A0ABQ8FX39_9PEZI|nr:cytochrome protein [Macrophomina phaseolina]